MSKKIKKIFVLDEETIKKFETLREIYSSSTNSELLSRMIDKEYRDFLDNKNGRPSEKLDRILTAVNQVCRMSYHTRDALNSLICFYSPDTGFRSADGDLTAASPHEYMKSSEENYAAKLSAATVHKRGIEKNRKENGK